MADHPREPASSTPPPSEAEKEAVLVMGAAAHEIKNALGPLAMTLQLAERKAAAGEAIAREDLAFARAQLQHASRLVNDLLDVTQVELGALPVVPRPGDLAAAARAAADAFARTSGRPVTLALPPGPVPATFDPDRLAQVLANLLDNAAKYAPPPAAITLAVEPLARGARLEVRDQGPGLSPAAQQAIFQRFVRAREPHDGTRGLGLGLYLCREIVARHGGRIGVESAPGQGATFWLELA